MLVWAPRAPANDTPDVCGGVDEYIASRAGPSQEFITINTALFISFVVFMVVTLMTWIAFRNVPRLQSRRLGVTLLTFAVCLLGFVVIMARRMTVGSNGGFAMGCQVHFWLYVTMGSIQSTVGVLRLLQLLNMARYARGVRRMKRIIIDDEKSESSRTNKSTTFANAGQDLCAYFFGRRGLVLHGAARR